MAFWAGIIKGIAGNVVKGAAKGAAKKTLATKAGEAIGTKMRSNIGNSGGGGSAQSNSPKARFSERKDRGFYGHIKSGSIKRNKSFKVIGTGE